MRDYLKQYKVKLTVVGPVFIGSGREIVKTEYIFLDRNRKIAVMDMAKLHKVAVEHKLGSSFEKFMSGENRITLKKWLYENRIDSKKYMNCCKYILDSSGIQLSKGINVMEFVKDAYGKPYVPGSSLKGMLRTILLAGRILTNKEMYSSEISELSAQSNVNRDKQRYLKREIDKIEEKAFYTLERENVASSNAVNDELSGLIVSDSRPLEIKNLILGQKVDCTVSGGDRNLPILRECLRPDTEIEFTISIDSTKCNVTKEEIIRAIELFNDNYYNCFLSVFQGVEKPHNHSVYLGGGSGFATKTVVYPLYGRNVGVPLIMNIFKNTISEKIFREHGHRSDLDIGVSPHIVKYTEYDDILFEMGLCRLEFM
ncbi:MAG: type III-A CRISPR-associated RAMP protein Csm5 [Anaerovoracaceae bacterium]